MPRVSESAVIAKILGEYSAAYQVTMTPRELSRRLGINPGTVHRALTTMVEGGLLDVADGSYFFGPVLEGIAIAARQRSVETRTAELITRLRDETNETVALTELRAGVKVVVLQAESLEELRTRTPVGRPLPITGTVSDMLFYAHTLEGTLGENLPAALEDLSAVQLEDLRRTRTCVTSGRAAGTLAVGCLMEPEPDGILRVISVVGPETRMRQLGAKHYIEHISSIVALLADARSL